MVSDTVEPIETLGQRLSRQAALMMIARTPTFGWLEPARTLLDHLESLPGPTAGRFDRIESGDSPVDVHDRVPAVRAPVEAEADVAATTGRALPSDVAAQVHRVIGRDVSAMRVHDDPAADAFARTHRADAVTVGRDVYFRQGRFRPRETDGFGLVAHEATHVSEVLAAGSAWRRLTRGGRDEEEHRAGAAERRASRDTHGPAARAPQETRRWGTAQARQFTHGTAPFVVPSPGPAPFGWSTPAVSHPPMTSPTQTAVQPAAPHALQPMTAAEDRADDTPPQLDLEALQRTLMEDLKRQLRSEFERGA